MLKMKHLEKTYKEDRYKHLKERIDLLIGILREKINTFDENKDKTEYINIVRYVHDELTDRIKTNLYSPKFRETEKNYLKDRLAEGDKLFNEFLNQVMSQAQERKSLKIAMKRDWINGFLIITTYLNNLKMKINQKCLKN